jgi:hypothetical protein
VLQGRRCLHSVLDASFSGTAAAGLVQSASSVQVICRSVVAAEWVLSVVQHLRVEVALHA